MSGRIVVIVMVGVSLALGVLLWWTLTRAYYDEVSGVEAIDIAGYSLDVTGYRGIAAESSPIKMRGCFEVADLADIAPALAAGAEATAELTGAGVAITPLIAPDWFECFDAEAITDDIAAGSATAVVAARHDADGVDRLVVLWPDGRGVTWRQLNEKYAE